MKLIKYKILSHEINHGTEENPDIEQFFIDVVIECPSEEIFDANYPIAEKEVYPGTTIDITGEFDPVTMQETTEDILNALLGV